MKMTFPRSYFLMLGLSLLGSLPLAAAPRLSAERLDVFDRRGYFTPAFKEAIHQLVSAQQDVVATDKQTSDLKSQLPDLQKKLADAQAKVAELKQELASYEHPEEVDFTTLQSHLSDDKVPLVELLKSVQGYIWAYPNSPHQAEAQQELQQLQTKIANQTDVARTADDALAAKRADLQKRAVAKQLSLVEWKEFLNNMSQEEVMNYLGRPQGAGEDFWIYRGDWTADPITGQKVGLMLSFNGARVNAVTEAPPDYQNQ